MSSNAVVVRTASRTPLSDVISRSIGFSPFMAAYRSAASSTVLQSGPTVSNFAASGTAPLRLSTPEVVLRPTRSFHADGIRTEPPVSDPIPADANPYATDVAAPEDDPPGAASGSWMFGGVAVLGFTPSPEKANSVWCVLPRQTKP